MIRSIVLLALSGLSWAQSPVWVRQFGTGAGDFANALAADGTSVYVTGGESGDVFVRKYDKFGTLVWEKLFGTSSSTTYTTTIAVIGNGVYVAGGTYASLAGANAGALDGFVRKYDTNGNVLWTQQFGTNVDDFANGISADASGVYVTGYSASGGFPMADFLRKYDTNGNLSWAHGVTSTPGLTLPFAITAAGGYVYVAGSTGDALDGPNAGAQDGFVRKFDAAGTV